MGIVNQTAPQYVALRAGEQATVSSSDPQSFGTVYVYGPQAGSESIASAVVSANGFQTLGPYPKSARLLIAPSAGALNYDIAFVGNASGVQTTAAPLAAGATSISGTAPANSTVPVSKGTPATPVGTAVADATGAWTLALGTPAALNDVYRTFSGSVVTGSVLNSLSVSAGTATVGAPFTATIGSLTPGSTLSLTGAGAMGLTVSGFTISGTPTAAGPVNIVETNVGSTNSPRTTAGLITVAAATGAPSPLSISGANGTATVGDTTSF